VVDWLIGDWRAALVFVVFYALPGLGVIWLIRKEIRP